MAENLRLSKAYPFKIKPGEIVAAGDYLTIRQGISNVSTQIIGTTGNPMMRNTTTVYDSIGGSILPYSGWAKEGDSKNQEKGQILGIMH